MYTKYYLKNHILKILQNVNLNPGKCNFYNNLLSKVKTHPLQTESLTQTQDIEDLLLHSINSSQCSFYAAKTHLRSAKLKIISNSDFIRPEKQKQILGLAKPENCHLFVSDLESLDSDLRQQSYFLIDYHFLEKASAQIVQLKGLLNSQQSLQVNDYQSMKSNCHQQFLVNDPIQANLKDYSHFQEKELFRKLDEKISDPNFEGQKLDRKSVV